MITRPAVREMPPKRGRGGANNANQHKPRAKDTSNRVCKPTMTKFPSDIIPRTKREAVPAPIVSALDDFRNCQPFFSALDRIDPESASVANMNQCWLGISGELIRALRRSEDDSDRFFGELECTETTYPVFIKRIHIIDPIQAIEGECVWPADGALPAPSEPWLNALEKLNDPLNEAYVDAVFASMADKLVTSNISPHWVRCYGTFPARVEKYLYNISEEYSSLKQKPFWKRNQELGIFKLQCMDVDSDSESEEDHTRPVFSDSLDLDMSDFESVEVSASQPTSASPTIEKDSEIELIDDCINLSAPKVRIRKLESSSASSASSYSSSESDETDDSFQDYYAEFDDFPVQVTLLERAEGTLDELLDNEEGSEEEKEARWKAWMFQIIAALDVAQHMFGFVHNDLHSNNVMWTKTSEEYLYYRVHKIGNDGKGYILRVPTFGYIMKIIDFGRASFWLPEPAGFFISDAFYPGNDASDQYNCDPFFDPKFGKKVEPNPSFDLSRLSVSIIESLFPSRPENATPIKIMSREDKKTYAETVSPLYNLLWEWLLDDQGHNILRLPNGDERYPDFTLYSAIAAEVHKAIPSHQIEKSLFAEYKFEGSVPAEKVYSVWSR